MSLENLPPKKPITQHELNAFVKTRLRLEEQFGVLDASLITPSVQGVLGNISKVKDKAMEQSQLASIMKVVTRSIDHGISGFDAWDVLTEIDDMITKGEAVMATHDENWDED